MGIFANTAIRESYGYAPDELSDVKLQAYDAEDTIFESTLISLAEADSDWRDIMDRMAAKEYAVLEATGQEMIYEAVDIKGFFNTVVEWFKKLWSKIAGLFQKFLSALSGKISSDQKFLDKYEAKIKTGYNMIPSGGFAFKGHEFENLNAIEYEVITLSKDVAREKGVLDVYESLETSGSKKDIQAMKKSIETFRKAKGDMEDQIRGLVLKGKGKIPANEFSKKCRDYLYGKQYSQFTGKGKQMSASDIIDEIKNGKYSKEKCKINYNSLKNAINTTIADINNKSKNSIGTNTDDELKGLKMQAASLITGIYRTVGSVYQTVNGIQLSAMNARHSEARSIAMKCVQLANKETAVNASAMMDTESFEDLMDY